MTCSDLYKRLGPEEFDGQMCTAAQKEHFDHCCYHVSCFFNSENKTIIIIDHLCHLLLISSSVLNFTAMYLVRGAGCQVMERG